MQTDAPGLVMTELARGGEAAGTICHISRRFHLSGSGAEAGSRLDTAALGHPAAEHRAVPLARQAPAGSHHRRLQVGLVPRDLTAARNRARHGARWSSKAAARKATPGGPIFNEQGELAGVLFGEGAATPQGSYQGRVHAFLTSMSADLAKAAATPMATSTLPQAPLPVAPAVEPPPSSPRALDPRPADDGSARSIIRDEPWPLVSHSALRRGRRPPLHLLLCPANDGEAFDSISLPYGGHPGETTSAASPQQVEQHGLGLVVCGVRDEHRGGAELTRGGLECQ